jgi:hypothetical protein
VSSRDIQSFYPRLLLTIFAIAVQQNADTMPFTVEYDEERQFVVAVCSGKLDLSIVQTVASEVSRIAARTGCRLILNDLRSAQLTRDAFDVYRIPRVLQEVGIAPTVKRALVVGDRQEEFRFLETVFLNYGNEVRLFTDTPDAEAWLLG